MKYFSAIKNDFMNFFGKWKELENIILSEGTQPPKDMCGMYSLKSGLAIKYRYHVTLHRPKEAKQEGKHKRGSLNLSLKGE